jgi:ubiquinone/menaquinone biosynthesis C-methylase UbiE
MNTPLRNPYSKEFSNFYDIYTGNYTRVTQSTNALLDTYNPNGIELLDLGCGTGKVLESLPKRYSFSGLDFSKHMLGVAKKKFPKASFYLADMTSFQLNKQFDAVICLSDSINHLHSFSEWQNTFKHVYKHLKKGGVFIFDMNTLVRLEKLSSMKPYVSPFTHNHFFTVNVTHVKKYLYSFYIQIFSRNKETMLLSEETIMESSFPLEEVEKVLKKFFVVKEMIDVIRPKVTPDTGKIIFVCTKKM